jgi:hypothetical protein
MAETYIVDMQQTVFYSRTFTRDDMLEMGFTEDQLAAFAADHDPFVMGDIYVASDGIGAPVLGAEELLDAIDDDEWRHGSEDREWTVTVKR